MQKEGVDMPNGDYWIKRQEDLQNSLLKPSEDYTAEVAKGYREAIREIEKQIAVWYQRFADNNKTDLTAANRMLSGEELKELKWDVWEYIKHGEQNAIDQRWMRELENASARAHISRLEALKLQIWQQAEKLYGGRADKVKELIGDVYRESLYKNGYEDFLRTGTEHIFDRIDQKKLNKIIDKPWTVDGKNFSERIWGNKQKLINELNNELTRGIAMGENPNKTAKALAQKLNSDFNATRRLVMTESAYFATQGQKECYKELDVEEYEILGTLDSTTCERCGSYDGKHFPTKDMQVGVNAPPFHPNCRCTTIPYFDDEFTQNEKRAATDENGNYIEVGNMNYEEWKNKYVKDVANGDESGIIKLTDDEQYAINRYISSDSYRINEKLRNNAELTEDDKKFIADLDSALSKMPDYKGDLVRSLYITDKEDRQRFIDKFIVGEAISFDEYLSTSNKEVYNPDADIQIYIKNSTMGKDITKYNPDELEILYMRNSKFKVIKKAEQNGVMYILLEELE